MPDWIAVILLGIIEGITEFIPVSSTGHLLIAKNWMSFRPTDLFIVVIQCGAVIAVLPLFPERLKQFLFHWREPATRDYLLKIFAAFFITGAGGLVLEKNDFKLSETVFPVAGALLIGGILFVVIERFLKGKALRNEITWTIVVAVGIGQLLAAIFPGSSRSGTTILLALMLGLNRPMATEFSFLVGIPTLLAAGVLKISREVSSSSPSTENWALLALGAIVAAAVSFVAVKWLLRYVQTHTFVAFGWYRIVLAIVLFFLAAP
jgi:undecaprenyl-diphosphatase